MKLNKRLISLTVCFVLGAGALSAQSLSDFPIQYGGPFGAASGSGGGGSGTPGGSNTQVQYNNAGAFGGVTGATTNGTFLTLTTPVLGVATGTSLALGGCTIGSDAICWTGTATGSGRLTAASFVPTSSTVPSDGIYLSAANTLAFAVSSTRAFSISGSGLNANSSSGALVSSGAASSTVPTLVPNRGATTTGWGAQASGNISGVIAGAEQLRISAPAASTPGYLSIAAPFTGGTGSTTFPLMHFTATGASSISDFSTSGTYIGVNGPSGFAGNFLDFHVNGAASVFKVASTGAITSASLSASSAVCTDGSKVLTTSGCSAGGNTTLTQGTFTPTVGGSGTFGTTTYNTQKGRWRKYTTGSISEWHVDIYVRATLDAGATGDVILGNLPFTVNASAVTSCVIGTAQLVTLTDSYTQIAATPNGGATTITLQQMGSGQTAQNIAVANWGTNAFVKASCVIEE